MTEAVIIQKPVHWLAKQIRQKTIAASRVTANILFEKSLPDKNLITQIFRN